MTRSRKRNQTPAFKPNKAALISHSEQGNTEESRRHHGQVTKGAPQAAVSAWSTAQKGRHNTVRGGPPFHLLRTSPERMCDYEAEVSALKV